MIAKDRRPRPSPPPPEDRDDDDAALIAHRIALNAGVQAARLREQASVQTAAICAAAEREAETIWRQASAQATAIREAAEHEAAELRASVMKLSAGLGEISRTDDRPAAAPSRGSPSRGSPPHRPATKPVDRGKANKRGRQARAMRKVTTALVVLSLAGVTSGAVEIKLHGLSFFLFRNAGAGAGNSRDLNENQGPGQPDAPPPQRISLRERVRHEH